jgi:hypothetical protein
VRTKQRRAIRNMTLFILCGIASAIAPDAAIPLWAAFAAWNLGEVLRLWPERRTIGGYMQWRQY